MFWGIIEVKDPPLWDYASRAPFISPGSLLEDGGCSEFTKWITPTQQGIVHTCKLALSKEYVFFSELYIGFFHRAWYVEQAGKPSSPLTTASKHHSNSLRAGYGCWASKQMFMGRNWGVNILKTCFKRMFLTSLRSKMEVVKPLC